MKKKYRKLKVVQHLDDRPVASLPLKGQWLEEAGFRIGREANIIVGQDCLIIVASSTVKS